MLVNELLRMKVMAECLGKRSAFLVQKRPWNPSSSIFPRQWLYRSVGKPSFEKSYSSAACYVTLMHDKCVLDCTTLASNILI